MISGSTITHRGMNGYLRLTAEVRVIGVCTVTHLAVDWLFEIDCRMRKLLTYTLMDVISCQISASCDTKYVCFRVRCQCK